jgi:hypothetical protein
MHEWRSPLLAAIAGMLGAALALSSSAQNDMDRGLVVAGATAGFMAFGYWLGTDRNDD